MQQDCGWLHFLPRSGLVGADTALASCHGGEDVQVPRAKITGIINWQAGFMIPWIVVVDLDPVNVWAVLRAVWMHMKSIAEAIAQ